MSERISYAVGLQRLAGAIQHGIACASHYAEPCDCGVGTDVALCRALAGLIAGDQYAPPWILEINGESFATESGIALLQSLAAGFDPTAASDDD